MLACCGAVCMAAQAPTSKPASPVAGGVYVTAEGLVKCRDVPRRMPAPESGELCHVSLPRLFAAVRALSEAGKPLPADMLNLGGLTQVRYVLADPDRKDLVIAGPVRPTTMPANRGRPTLKLDDLIMMMRFVRGKGWFGCSIDPTPGSMERSNQVMKDFATASRAARMAEMAKALGPQVVTVFGTPPESRISSVTVFADYRMKRCVLGLDPVPGLGNAFDASRTAAFRFWFEAKYDPLLVSDDGTAFQLRGPRLHLLCGALNFDPRGATPAANAYARAFTEKIPALAGAMVEFAELQNVTDLSIVAALIRMEKLDQRVKWDPSWVLENFRAERFTPPRTAEVLVTTAGGSIVAGGVRLAPFEAVERMERQADDGSLGGVRKAVPQGRWRVTGG